MDGFLPFQQDYIFTWYFKDAITTLLDRIAFLKTATILKDQCPQMCPAIHLALERLGKVGGELRRLCKWHKVSINHCRLTLCHLIYLCHPMSF